MQETPLPIVLRDGQLTNSGGDLLSGEISASRFVLIGESHLSREIPQFTAAVCNAMHPDAYVTEAAPSAAALTSSLIGKPDRIARMQNRLRAFPESMAFLNVRDENDLAETCAQSSHNPHFQLWGLDQEYLGSAGWLLQAMVATRPGQKTRAALATVQTGERNAEAKAHASGDYLKLYLITIPDEDVKALTDAVNTDGTPETKRLLQEFTASRHIYRLALDRNGETNRERSPCS